LSGLKKEAQADGLRFLFCAFP